MLFALIDRLLDPLSPLSVLHGVTVDEADMAVRPVPEHLMARYFTNAVPRPSWRRDDDEAGQ